MQPLHLFSVQSFKEVIYSIESEDKYFPEETPKRQKWIHIAGDKAEIVENSNQKSSLRQITEFVDNFMKTTDRSARESKVARFELMRAFSDITDSFLEKWTEKSNGIIKKEKQEELKAAEKLVDDYTPIVYHEILMAILGDDFDPRDLKNSIIKAIIGNYPASKDDIKLLSRVSIDDWVEYLIMKEIKLHPEEFEALINNFKSYIPKDQRRRFVSLLSEISMLEAKKYMKQIKPGELDELD